MEAVNTPTSKLGHKSVLYQDLRISEALREGLLTGPKSRISPKFEDGPPLVVGKMGKKTPAPREFRPPPQKSASKGGGRRKNTTDSTDDTDKSDAITDGRIQLVINTPRGKASKADDAYIRTTAIKRKVPYITTLAAAVAAAKGVAAMRKGRGQVKSLQSYHADIR